MARFAHLLFLGKLDPDRRRSLSAIAQASKLELANVESTPAALSWLEHNEPSLVAFDTRVSRADKVCEKVRARTALAGVPLIALTSEIGDVFVEKLYSMGADDVIPAEQNAALLARLKALPLGEPPESMNARGRAVVCDPDKARGAVFGRVLSNAGYDVKLALDDVAVKYFSQQTDVRLMVAGAELGVTRGIIEQSRKKGSEAVWVITAQRKEITKVRERLEGLDNVSVMGAYLPPESVLFSSNEMLSGSNKAARESPRLLYGTCVWFRGAGEDDDELGLSYNISSGGLFVRTLLPPPEEQVWLELRPPRQKRRVRLVGRIAWRRGFDLASMAAAPPGFGVEIRDGLGEDRQLFLDGYHTLIETPRTSVPAIHVPKNLPELVALSAPIGVAVRDSQVPEEPTQKETETAPSSAPRPAPPRPRQASPELEPGPEAGPAPSPEPAPVSAPPPAEPFPAPAASVDPALPPPAPPRAPQAAIDIPKSPALPAEAQQFAPEPATAAKPSGLGGLVAGGALVGVALAVSFFAYEWWRARDDVGGAPDLPTATASASPVESSVPPPASAAATPAKGSETVAPSQSAAPAESAAPSASVAAAPEDDGDDGSSLNWGQGYLIVESTTAADVYATGFKVGTTNEKNQSACGLKFVRLGKGDPPSWLTKGQTVDVKCRAITRVKLEP